MNEEEMVRAGEYLEVVATDEKGAGGAKHEYVVRKRGSNTEVMGSVKFQKGPILEDGVNGVHNEDLLAIVIHRLQCFSVGPFPSRENSLALTKCQEALMWLEARTANRKARGVEGKTMP